MQSNFNQEKKVLENELARLREQLRNKDSQLEQLQRQLKDQYLLEKEVEEYANRIVVLENENNRLNTTLTQKLEQTEMWKQKYIKLEQGRLPQLEKTFKELENKNNELINQNLQLSQDLDRANATLRQKMYELQTSQQQYTEVVTTIHEQKQTIMRLEQSNPAQEKEIQDKARTIEALQAQLKARSYEIEELRVSNNRYDLNQKNHLQQIKDQDQKINLL